jgi:predicted Zn-dependent protease/preprotein translocase subunit SecG
MKKIVVILLFMGLLISCSKEDAVGEMSSSGFVVSNNKKITGSSANDLLSDATFKSMVVEIVYVEGFEPTAIAVNDFVSFLNARTNKSQGISVVKRAIASPGKSIYSINDITAIEDANRTKYNTGNQIAVWVLFIDGASSSDSGNNFVIGTAYRNTSIVIFEKTVQSLTNTPFKPNRSLVESTVVSHEFGHILGLTNLGTTMQTDHEDKEHPKHCTEKTCLMFWQTESSSGMMNMISGGSAPKLDAQCLADLKANGGK